MIKYYVAYSSSLPELMTNVNECLKHGWKLQGSIFVVQSRSGFNEYFQTLWM